MSRKQVMKIIRQCHRAETACKRARIECEKLMVALSPFLCEYLKKFNVRMNDGEYMVMSEDVCGTSYKVKQIIELINAGHGIISTEDISPIEIPLMEDTRGNCSRLDCVYNENGRCDMWDDFAMPEDVNDCDNFSI